MTQLKSNFNSREARNKVLRVRQTADERVLFFPSGFLWGAATSAHQVEGNNHNDWAEWEYANSARLAASAAKRHANAHMRIPNFILNNYPNPLQPENYISGRACDHYNRYEEDFDIAKSLSHNAHRFSIEWSRIEPEEGKFNEEAIDHYRQVIRALRERNIEPFVTLWHFTNPIWIGEIGGWENKKTIDYYLRYAEKVVNSFSEVKYWTTFNEPNIYAGYSYIKGSQPPGIKNIFRAIRVFNNILNTHKKTYQALQAQNRNIKIGLVSSVVHFEGLFKHLADYVWNFYTFNKVVKSNDFIGLNYYKAKQIGFSLRDRKGELTDLGWEIFPEGIYHVTKKFTKYNLPIFITENGLADADDSQRANFIKKHLFWLHKAIREGVDIRGYFYWSFLEIFEMVEMRGFWPRFGLVEVDYKTMKRKIRNSAYEYAKICKSNSLEI